MFSALFSDGLFLLPLFVFAFFLGLGLSYEKNYCKPVTSLFDSLSRVFYHIGVVFTEFLALAIIALSAFWAVRFHAALRAEVFRDLILLLGIFSAVLVFGIFPLFLYLLKPQKNPWHLLYGILGPSIGAFFSGDMNFSLPLLVRHVKENLGVRRRSSSVSLSLFAVFGRAGSAMVAASAFIVIIKSYSLLDISPTDVLTIGLRALLISFALGRFPGSGAYTALAVLGMGYGSIFEAGYLILKPLAFYLIAVGAFIDVVIAALCSYAVGKISGFQEDKEARHFI
jgi:Na+/H+-dicarboxylate symporter